MKTFKRLNLVQIIGIIVMIIAFILNLFSIKGMVDLFFIGLSLNALGFTLSTIKWSKEGKTGFRKMDKSYSKNLTRKSSDTMLFLNVGYYLCICLLVLTEIIDKTYFKPIFSLMPIFIFSVVANIVLLLVIDTTYDQVVKLIKK